MSFPFQLLSPSGENSPSPISSIPLSSSLQFTGLASHVVPPNPCNSQINNEDSNVSWPFSAPTPNMELPTTARGGNGSVGLRIEDT